MGERRRLRPGVRRGLIAVGALTAVVGAAYGSTYTMLFAADAVRVDGAARMSPEDVRRLGGVAAGDNVFHLDVAAIEERLEGDPRIADATVRTELPDAIAIAIVERVPVAVADVAGVETVVADDGELLPGSPPSSLPRIEVVAGQLDDARRRSAAGVLAVMTPSLRRSISTLYWGTDDQLVLETVDRVTVTYGGVAEERAKADALRAVLAWAAADDVDLAAIDVTVPAAPTARTPDGTVTPG